MCTIVYLHVPHVCSICNVVHTCMYTYVCHVVLCMCIIKICKLHILIYFNFLVLVFIHTYMTYEIIHVCTACSCECVVRVALLIYPLPLPTLLPTPFLSSTPSSSPPPPPSSNVSRVLVSLPNLK